MSKLKSAYIHLLFDPQSRLYVSPDLVLMSKSFILPQLTVSDFEAIEAIVAVLNYHKLEQREECITLFENWVRRFKVVAEKYPDSDLKSAIISAPVKLKKNTIAKKPSPNVKEQDSANIRRQLRYATGQERQDLIDRLDDIENF